MKKVLKLIAGAVFVLTLALIFIGQMNIGNYDRSDLPEANYVSVLDEELRYVQKGTGRDILFIHGTPGSLESWNAVFDELSEEFRLTAYDRPGHGYSSANACDYSLKHNAEIVEELIQTLGLQDPLIVGHSYGGSTVAYLAAKSDQISSDSKLVIIDSPLYQHTPDATFKLIAIPLIGQGIATFTRYTIAGSRIEEGLLERFVSFPKDDIPSFVALRKKLWQQPKVTYTTSKERVNYQDNLDQISSHYSKISHDLTIITGSDPDKTQSLSCKKMKEDCPSAALIVLDDTGHMIQFEKRNELVNIIKRLMKEKKDDPRMEELIAPLIEE